MTKQEIYKAINDFNETEFDDRYKSSDPRHKKFLYVTTEIAKDRATFLKYLKANDPVFKMIKQTKPKVLDLAFGSGSLTTHLVLENFSDYDTLLFNDKIVENTFQKIEDSVEKALVTKKDFLKSEEFTLADQSDIIVFNPQIGGGYKDGDSALKDNITPIIYGASLAEYLNKQKKNTIGLRFNINHSKRTITVTSDEHYQNYLEDLLAGIKIYNYYDVFYQSFKSKKTTEKGESTTNVAFRRTFDKVFKRNGLLLFYGSESTFNALFADFKYVVEYRSKDEGNHFFVALKSKQDKNKAKRCYKRSQNGKSFVEIPDCKDEDTDTLIDGNLDEIETDIGQLMTNLNLKTTKDSLVEVKEATLENKETMKTTKEAPFKIDVLLGHEFPNFAYKNILLKGVPGTGKSRLINESFIKQQLKLGINSPNVLRINIHSASSNADMMQGIAIRTNKGQVEYKEKTGLVLRHLRKAICSPFEAFVIVLEEIQENSLNELIGDLIYLIETEKRVNLREKIAKNEIKAEYTNEAAFLEELCKDENLYYVEMPYLVSDEASFKKMVLPDNLYFFCTSNYRDDKKVIEDNLLRRFEVIEIYPKNQAVIGTDYFLSKEVSDFLEALNTAILKEFRDKEIHPDRFMIGHAIWLTVTNKAAFCRALLRVITEFKDVKEVEFKEVRNILKAVGSQLPFDLEKADLLTQDYQTLIIFLQSLAYPDILNA